MLCIKEQWNTQTYRTSLQRGEKSSQRGEVSRLGVGEGGEG